MSQGYHSGTSGARSVSSDGHKTYGLDSRAGIEAVRTMYRGPNDPSDGADPAWGADELGTLWMDDSDPIQTIVYQWSQLDSGPTYGWRTLSVPKLKWLHEVALASRAVSFSPASPAAADVAFTAVDLTTLLNDLQDAGQVTHLVTAVLLRIRVRTGASETITAATDHAYFAVRRKSAGASTEDRIYCQVQNRFVEAQVWVPLDSGEEFDFSVKVGGGTPAFEYAAWVDALVELAL